MSLTHARSWLASAWKRVPLRLFILGVIVLVTFVIGSIMSPYFLRGRNLQNILEVASILGVAAVGQTFALLIRELDLSVGSLMSLVVVVAVALMNPTGVSFFITVLSCLALGAVAGLVNGVFVAKAKASSLIVTLATMVMLQGIALQMRTSPGGLLPRAFSKAVKGTVLNIPVTLLIFVGVVLITWFLLNRTTIGKYIYASGMDDESARLAGINVERIKVLCFVICGVLASAAGILMAARLASADPRVGEPFAFDSITAVVLGGTTFVGGQGGVVGTFYGAVLISMIRNILNLANVSPFYQYIARGVILFGVVAAYSSRLRGRR
jgi:ribose transport system permease protein